MVQGMILMDPLSICTCLGSLQAAADHAFESLGGDKDVKFKAAREELIEAVFREIGKLGMHASLSQQHCMRLITFLYTRTAH